MAWPILADLWLLKQWREWKRKNPELTVDPNGQRSKELRGKSHYFGALEDVDGVLAKWTHDAPYLKAGKTPPRPGDDITVGDLVTKFKADIVLTIPAWMVRPRPGGVSQAGAGSAGIGRRA